MVLCPRRKAPPTGDFANLEAARPFIIVGNQRVEGTLDILFRHGAKHLADHLERKRFLSDEEKAFDHRPELFRRRRDRLLTVLCLLNQDIFLCFRLRQLFNLGLQLFR